MYFQKQNRDNLEEKGHPRPTGYRGYLSKVEIRGPAGRNNSGSDEAQTSSTDLGDSTDRSSNADSKLVKILNLLENLYRTLTSYESIRNRRISDSVLKSFISK